MTESLPSSLKVWAMRVSHDSHLGISQSKIRPLFVNDSLFYWQQHYVVSINVAIAFVPAFLTISISLALYLLLCLSLLCVCVPITISVNLPLSHCLSVHCSFLTFISKCCGTGWWQLVFLLNVVFVTFFMLNMWLLRCKATCSSRDSPAQRVYLHSITDGN